MKITVLVFKSSGEVPDSQFEYCAESYPRVGEFIARLGCKDIAVRRVTHHINTMLAQDLNCNVTVEAY
jgi:hypothetical protein